MSELIKRDISHNKWREYEFGPMCERIHYRIENPVELYTHPGATTHRIVDSNGVTHCVPAPGFHGCVLRWEGEPPVKF